MYSESLFSTLYIEKKYKRYKFFLGQKKVREKALVCYFQAPDHHSFVFNSYIYVEFLIFNAVLFLLKISFLFNKRHRL